MMKYNVLLFVLLMVMSIGTCLSNVNAKSDSDIDAMYKADLAYRSHFFNIVAYCDEDQIKKWNCGTACNMHPTFTTYDYVTDPDLKTAAYVGIDNASKQVVVAFRGSANEDNWKLNFDCKTMKYQIHECPGNCEVHTGFWLAYQSLIAQIRTDVEKLLKEHKNYTLLVTGHSLGAAMATLTAVDLSFLLRDMYNVSVDDVPMELYTMGSPRIGNEDFVTWAYNQLPYGKHFRITHHRDPVPQVPFEYMGYIHIPTEVYYPTYDNVTFTVQNDSVTAESEKGTNQFEFDPFDASDHTSYFGLNSHCDAKPILTVDMANEFMLASSNFKTFPSDLNALHEV